MCYPIIIRKQELPVTIREKRTSISQFAAADLSSEALFSLFECLAVLVHLRKLAHPAIPLDEAEEELLFQFEHSGEWLPDDTTLVADWYWRTSAALPSH